MAKKKHGGRREGAGRKPLYDEKLRKVEIWLTAEQVEAANAAAERRGKKRSEWLRDLVTRALKREKL